MTAAPASDAEALSCATAARYASRWALAVARPVDDDDRPDPPAPWFIDGFAGADLQRAALRGATVRPAAILAVQVLDDAIDGNARIVLIEEDPGLIARLHEMLDGIGVGGRVRISSDPATAEPGEILLVESAFTSHAHRLAQRIGDEPALVRLAPLAARGLPWTALEPIASLASADVLLRFPVEDFEKQARFTGPLADLPPHLRRVVEGCSNFLGDARYAWLMAWREAQRTAGPDAALATAVERMQALLASVGEDRLTPALHVAGRTESVHLLLSTPHAEHSAELDAALADGATTKPKSPPKRKAAASAKSQTAEPPAPVEAPSRESPAQAAEPAEPAAESAEPVAEPAVAPGEPAAEPPTEPAALNEEPAAEPPSADTSPAAAPPAAGEPLPANEPAAALDLFALASEPEPEPRGPDLTAFADDLYARHVGARVGFGELLASAAEAGLTPEQVRAALASLKRAGRASYKSLDAEGAEVEFLAEPRPSAPRPRKQRAPAPELLGLFDDEPEE